ncbi:hypothetical protein [Pedobacter montanisoli]|uniref:Uncharacterized protein n=1 Tax=Pedobacter montanisoli TaxID=2923277 RepID=A0ABS9ZSY7_9SPHI|nr:hypothetical protein [Pedobacter montanisoli]MCJ0741715.1 hypothetical protein [Pedobacter montanisoli]
MKQTYLIILVLLTSCATKIKAQNTEANEINNAVNSRYISSRKTFTGKLDDIENKDIREKIAKELNRNIDADKAILINYFQRGPNCITYKYNNETYSSMLNNTVNISNRITAEKNAVDFFIYAKDAFHLDLLKDRKDFIQDSGFFQSNVFTIQENCGAFLILKPDGRFMKCYDEDYFTEVDNFLKQK